MVCHYAERHYAEFRVLFIVMLNVFMLSVVVLNVVMLNVVIPFVVAPIHSYDLHSGLSDGKKSKILRFQIEIDEKIIIKMLHLIHPCPANEPILILRVIFFSYIVTGLSFSY
jgi:hypothetical protein